MRPKRKILLIDSNEERRSVRCYVLTNRGFAVHAAANAEEALHLAAVTRPDLAVLCWPLEKANAAALLALMHQRYPATRQMVIAEQLAEPPANIIADRVLLKGHCSQFEIYEQASILCARKRGPKRFAPASECSTEGADAAERRIA
jgi:two-component system response regulator CpxR